MRAPSGRLRIKQALGYEYVGSYVPRLPSLTPALKKQSVALATLSLTALVSSRGTMADAVAVVGACPSIAAESSSMPWLSGPVGRDGAVSMVDSLTSHRWD